MTQEEIAEFILSVSNLSSDPYCKITFVDGEKINATIYMEGFKDFKKDFFRINCEDFATDFDFIRYSKNPSQKLLNPFEHHLLRKKVLTIKRCTPEEYLQWHERKNNAKNKFK